MCQAAPSGSRFLEPASQRAATAEDHPPTMRRCRTAKQPATPAGVTVGVSIYMQVGRHGAHDVTYPALHSWPTKRPYQHLVIHETAIPTLSD